GPLGNFGLSVWPEIKPKGVRDAAFLVLKKQGQPLHFCVIAQNAGELQGELFSKRKMLPQTIHNELIRDPRFVLVGRGIYGLDEWGYTPGTVKEVIYKILEVNSPLAKEEILSAVQKQRMVKPNTVFLSLSDKQKFSRNTEGKYILAIKTA
ncbi:MAG: winged helix-turn-helix domain-containing protein, partial [Candidatus Pacebacteria bacterium]|nr:winged helix-turn-helix domain-containing protein [Candidatus Paceibacterota bacterium]